MVTYPFLNTSFVERIEEVSVGSNSERVTFLAEWDTFQLAFLQRYNIKLRSQNKFITGKFEIIFVKEEFKSSSKRTWYVLKAIWKTRGVL